MRLMFSIKFPKLLGIITCSTKKLLIVEMSGMNAIILRRFEANIKSFPPKKNKIFSENMNTIKENSPDKEAKNIKLVLAKEIALSIETLNK